MRHLLLPKHKASDLGHKSIAPETLPISNIIDGYATGRFLPSDIVGACLNRISTYEPEFNAFIAINQSMLEHAAVADAVIASKDAVGPLHGVPIIIKDNMNQQGFRTTAGYAGFAADECVAHPDRGPQNGVDLWPVADATLVSRLKAAGAIIIGKSNLPDFGLDALRANSSYNGNTLNPYNLRFAPGASSSGSATGVAAGFGAASIGTDTVGSILFPASAQSLVGLKPSFGLIPIDGVFPGLSSHHDVAGPMTKTVLDAAIMLDVLAGPTEKDPRTIMAKSHGAFRDGSYCDSLKTGALRGKRIGLFEPGQWAEEMNPIIAGHYDRMVAIVRSLGAVTVPIVFADSDWKQRWMARTRFVTCNSYLAGVSAFLAGLGGNNPRSLQAFSERAGFSVGLGTTAPLYDLLANSDASVAYDDPKLKAVIDGANDLYQRYEHILAEKSIDALFMPRSISPLPNIDDNTTRYLSDQVGSAEINEMGLPAITIPAGFLPDGRPIGVDIVGRARYTEADILSYAFDFEQATLLRRPPHLA